MKQQMVQTPMVVDMEQLAHMAKALNTPTIMTTKDVARYTGYHENTIRMAVTKGELRSTRPRSPRSEETRLKREVSKRSGTIRYRKEWVDAWLDKHAG